MCLCPGYTHVQLSCAACRRLGHWSSYLWSPRRPSGICVVLVGVVAYAHSSLLLGASALSPGCPDVLSVTDAVVPWAAWFGYPPLQLLVFVVVLSLLGFAAVQLHCWFCSGCFAAQLCSASVGCMHFALAAAADPSWDGSLITRMIVWLVDSGALHHMVPDWDLLHNFVPFATKPCTKTAI